MSSDKSESKIDRGLFWPSSVSESTSKENDKKVLSAISRLIVPATINLNQDLGVVTVNGSKADVERTNRIIDIIRKTADEKALSRFIERPASEKQSRRKKTREYFLRFQGWMLQRLSRLMRKLAL